MHSLALALLVWVISSAWSNEASPDDHVLTAGAEQLEAHNATIAKPDQVKPEQVKPEPVKPEQVKPEPVKPEQVKPEPVKPEPVKRKPTPPKDATAPLPFPPKFLEGKPAHRAELKALNEANPPELDVITWLNSNPLTMQELKGKVIVLDFWATWCGPCLEAIPRNNALTEKYKDNLVLIGVCHDRGVENMPAVVEDKGIKYPVCRDHDTTTIKAYLVDSYPDYYVFDKNGRLRIADCTNTKLEEAITQLIAEE